MEARLGITNWLIQHDLASVEEVRDAEGELIDAYARVDRAAVLARGKEVMGELLVNIQTYKSTGDGKGATGELSWPPPFVSAELTLAPLPPSQSSTRSSLPLALTGSTSSALSFFQRSFLAKSSSSR